MKLSLSIIKERLGAYVKWSNMGCGKDSLHLSRPVFYTGETIFSCDTLYISNASILPKQSDFMEGSSLICISSPPESYFNDKLDLLVIDEFEDIFSLSNKVHKIYDAFDLWDSKLQQSTGEWNPLQYIINISEPIFKNGLAIMDSDYYIIAETELASSAVGYKGRADSTGSLSVEQVNSFKNDRTYREIVNKRDVFLFPNELLPYRCLCKNIFINEKFIFRIIVSETTSEFKDGDASLLEYMSQYLERASNHINALRQEENSVIISLFQDIIAGNSINKSEFDKELKKAGWSQKDAYRIMHIQPSSHDMYNTTMSFFCSKIMREFKQTFAFIYNNIIVGIINIDKISDSKDEYFAKFNYFIREGNFRAGFSNYSEGLHNLKEYSIQAGIALEIGLVQNPTIWVHKFSDNVFPYILRKMTDELPADFLYSPIISRLNRYDSENSTEYLKTLKVYLENNMNAVQTAKDLFIHRATIIYRLDRIKEIGETDLKNPDEILHLYLSFRLLNLE